jgi:hypothetical protein
MRKRMRPWRLLILLMSALSLEACASQAAWLTWEAPVIEPGVGVGPIRFGMTAEEMFQRLGRISSTSSGSYGRGNNLPPVEHEGYAYDGRFLHLNVYTYPDVGVQEISIADYRHLRFLPWHVVPRTASGITLGSRLAEVKAAYGEPSRTMDFADGSNLMEYYALGMRIDCDKSGRVDYIGLQPLGYGSGASFEERLAEEYEKTHPLPKK